jgi:GNAT superfamily N-acetyltransferase
LVGIGRNTPPFQNLSGQQLCYHPFVIRQFFGWVDNYPPNIHPHKIPGLVKFCHALGESDKGGNNGPEENTMNLPAVGSSLECLPRSFSDKKGMTVEMFHLPPEGGDRLIGMYLAFQPRNSFQGLPPIKDEVCIRWVREMLVTGIHIIAESAMNGSAGLNSHSLKNSDPPGGNRPAEKAILGHTAIFPVNPRKCEMLVVVCPGFQNLGIGTELVRSCIDLAEELGFEQIWLPVDATNVRARHVYRKCGFEYVSNKLGRELDMTCDVRQCRSRPAVDAKIAFPAVPAPCFHFSNELQSSPAREYS